MTTTEATRAGRASTRHGLAQVIAVVTVLLAVADLCRWGNRWYVSTVMPPPRSAELMTSAHAALLSALCWLALAALAAAYGWRLRVVRV